MFLSFHSCTVGVNHYSLSRYTLLCNFCEYNIVQGQPVIYQSGMQLTFLLDLSTFTVRQTECEKVKWGSVRISANACYRDITNNYSLGGRGLSSNSPFIFLLGSMACSHSELT
jgi:hypothetical protein